MQMEKFIRPFPIVVRPPTLRPAGDALAYNRSLGSSIVWTATPEANPALLVLDRVEGRRLRRRAFVSFAVQASVPSRSPRA
jgi:hypothetical protein